MLLPVSKQLRETRPAVYGGRRDGQAELALLTVEEERRIRQGKTPQTAVACSRARLTRTEGDEVRKEKYKQREKTRTRRNYQRRNAQLESILVKTKQDRETSVGQAALRTYVSCWWSNPL